MARGYFIFLLFRCTKLTVVLFVCIYSLVTYFIELIQLHQAASVSEEHCASIFRTEVTVQCLPSVGNLLPDYALRHRRAQ